jgi:membrane-bound ClpP family serine protease
MGLIITLIVIGLLLLIAEMIVIPGFGIAGILGLASFIGAIVLAFTQFKTWRKITLKQNIEDKALQSPAEKGITVGMEGFSLTRLNPSGNGRFGDVTVEVRSAQELIPPKTPIKVVYIEGLSIFVSPVENN